MKTSEAQAVPVPTLDGKPILAIGLRKDMPDNSTPELKAKVREAIAKELGKPMRGELFIVHQHSAGVIFVAPQNLGASLALGHWPRMRGLKNWLAKNPFGAA